MKGQTMTDEANSLRAQLADMTRQRDEALMAKVTRLTEALQQLLRAVCGPTGFAAAVRHNSGLYHPWPSLDAAEANARAALAENEGVK